MTGMRKAPRGRSSLPGHGAATLAASVPRRGRPWLGVPGTDAQAAPSPPRPPQGSSSSDSLEGQSCDYASKSYDAVVFDVLKVTPEEFAVSNRSGVGAGPAAGCRVGESLPWVSGGEVTALGVGRGSHWSGLFAQVGSNPYAQRRGIVE